MATMAGLAKRVLLLVLVPLFFGGLPLARLGAVKFGAMVAPPRSTAVVVAVLVNSYVGKPRR
jgi:hypothetical protein